MVRSNVSLMIVWITEAAGSSVWFKLLFCSGEECFCRKKGLILVT